jgi:hypothetical protein
MRLMHPILLVLGLFLFTSMAGCPETRDDDDSSDDDDAAPVQKKAATSAPLGVPAK